jgi:polyvinyl alcohol dehydrogenase (cytochrome)
MLTTTPSGRDTIVIGQKSGVGWALDPDAQGAVLWQYRAGNGGPLGGMEWGSATDGELAFFPVSDVIDGQQRPVPSSQAGTLHAVNVSDGTSVWVARPAAPACGTPQRNCGIALSAAISVIPGAVFAPSIDGAVRAFSTRDGSVLWTFDANRNFETVNGVKANGGAFDGGGASVVNGMVFIGSGSGGTAGRPGNVVLAFGLAHE